MIIQLFSDPFRSLLTVISELELVHHLEFFTPENKRCKNVHVELKIGSDSIQRMRISGTMDTKVADHVHHLGTHS